MDHAARDVGGIAGFERPLFPLHPLLHLPAQQIDDLIHLRVGVKGMRAAGGELCPHENERLRVAEAILEIPLVDLLFEVLRLGFKRGDEAAEGSRNFRHGAL